MENESKITEVKVRGISFKLFTFNRSLELCARMNYEAENLDLIDSLIENDVFF
jgi:hypothetical protein